ncbi:hypothetical protein Fmac_014313 [Flemingia macrophylla]|uniref:Bromo domain-containing protein n=1 Tax=Flemingia macrophylla TaxID=520843 RepID=A0ABD1MBC7_9FABA
MSNSLKVIFEEMYNIEYSFSNACFDIHVGERRKQMRYEDEIECKDRRKSRRIVEKKQQDKERKDNSLNNDNKNKRKDKAIKVVCDDLFDSNADEKCPIKKRHKHKELYQLISSIKVEHYYKIVKQPMDFGTIRAKLKEDMYTNLELFKRDVILIFSNAMNANLATSKYYQAAKDISKYAMWIFEALSADPEHFESEFSPNKRHSKLQKATKWKTEDLKEGRKKATQFKVPETEKRDMYWPPSKPMFSEVLYANKPIIQSNTNPIKYRESLLRFVEDLGPTAQRVAAKKLDALKDQQLCNDEIVSGTQIIHRPTPKTLTQPNTFNAQILAPAFPFLNRPLTIPGSATQENRIVTTTNSGSVKIRNGPYQGYETYPTDNWNACASALSSWFHNNDNGGSPSGIKGSNASGTTNFLDLLKDKMDSSLENVSSLLLPVQEVTNQLHLGVNITSNTRQWNTYSDVSNMLTTGSSSNAFAHVYPTRMISMSHSRISHPEPSFVLSHSRPENSKYCVPSNNLTELSLMHQAKVEGTINHSELSFLSQPRPKDFMYGIPSNNLRELSLVHNPLSQPVQGDLIPSKNLLGSTILSSLVANFSNVSNILLCVLGTSYQAKDFQIMHDSPYFNNVPHQAEPYSPPSSTHGFPDMPMRVTSPQEPKSSSSKGKAPLQLLWDNDKQPNLALKL